MFSMNIIYLDTLFFVNFVCDYILLLCTARVGGAIIHRWRLIIASVLGGLYACVCCCPIAPWLDHPLLKFCFSILLCAIAFNKESPFVRCTVIFMCVSFIAGGFLSALTMSNNNIQYIPLHFKSVFLAFAIMYFVLSLFFRNIPKFKDREYHSISVTLHDQNICFRGLHDSGNELFDPITNRPVLICQAKLLHPLFPNTSIWEEDVYKQFTIMSRPDQYQGKMRLIPCQTITGSGILLGFQADSVSIDGKIAPHIVAFSPIDFPIEASYQAIY